MASLTFVPRPPLPPPVHNIPEEHSSQLDLDSPITPMCPASPSNMQMPQDDTASPTSPISPLNSSPIDLSFLKSNHSAIRAVPPRPAHQRSAAAIATAPLSRPLGFGMHTYVGEDGDTPYNTPVPRPAGRLAVGPVGGGGAGIANAGAGGSPIGSPRAFALNSSLGGFGGVGGATPANTPANRPPPAGRLSMTSAAIGGGGAPGRVSGGLDHIHIPSSLSTPLGGLQPLNAATAMRNRSSGVGIGIGGVSANANGNGIGNGNGHAQGGGGFTPGNTPSSLERVSRRLANNLMVGPRDGVTHQIAPSYERRFNAGLLDINHKLSAQPEHPEGSQVDSPSQSVQQTYGGSLVNSHWPTKFDSDTVMSEGKGEGADK